MAEDPPKAGGVEATMGLCLFIKRKAESRKQKRAGQRATGAQQSRVKRFVSRGGNSRPAP